MSTTEQHIHKNGARMRDSGVFQRGTTLEPRHVMGKQSTFREITLIVGVVVALIVALTIYAAQQREALAGDHVQAAQSLKPAIKDIIAKAISIVGLTI